VQLSDCLRGRDIGREIGLGSSLVLTESLRKQINVGAQGNVCRDGVATILNAAWAVTPERRIERPGMPPCNLTRPVQETPSHKMGFCSSASSHSYNYSSGSMCSLTAILQTTELSQEDRYGSPGKDSSRQFHNGALNDDPPSRYYFKRGAYHPAPALASTHCRNSGLIILGGLVDLIAGPITSDHSVYKCIV
jgi:hypothetical protein